MISKQLVVGFSVVLMSVVSIADAQSSSRTNGNNNAVSLAGGAKDSVSFVNDVVPIINAKCGNCHVKGSKGRYNIKSYDALMKSESIEPKRPGSSLFIEVIENGEMPKGGLKVSDRELAVLKQWVEEGAKFDGDADAETQSMSGSSSRNSSTRGSQNGSARGSRGNAAGSRASSGRRSSGRRGRGAKSNAFDSNPLLIFLDTDGNGELSLAEIDAAKRLLYSLDTNEDDRLTGDEVNNLGK